MPGVTASSIAASSIRGGSREPREVAIPRAHQQLAGCILWLPPKNEIREGCGSDIEPDRCDHPVVILSPQAEDGRVVYLMITSLKGADLKARFNDQNLRLEHIPIRPNKPHPDNQMLLSLEDVTLVLRKKSYVKTKIQYRIQVATLRPYERRGPEYILSRKSYQELIQYAKFTPPAPHPSSTTVSPPGRERRYGQSVPITRERSGSYSEYVSAQRRLESAAISPPRSHYAPTTNTNSSRYVRTTVWGEQDPLLSQPSYTYPHSYPGSYPGSYPNNQPSHAFRTSSRAGYQSSGAPVPFDDERAWRRIKILFWISLALVGAYGTYSGVAWLVDTVKQTGSVVKGSVEETGKRIGNFWLPVLAKLTAP
ncbi:hypothetical protein F5Y11DRAFT_91111 [Daldinia sp. FL1419]|nr:hypothetical protein F5Y11DRAFT_91111 [Daldinia sp. FL1419]